MEKLDKKLKIVKKWKTAKIGQQQRIEKSSKYWISTKIVKKIKNDKKFKICTKYWKTKTNLQIDNKRNEKLGKQNEKRQKIEKSTIKEKKIDKQNEIRQKIEKTTIKEKKNSTSKMKNDKQLKIWQKKRNSTK